MTRSGPNDDLLAINRRRWDELVSIHQRSAYYDVEGFLAGKDTLHSLELREVGDVRGKSLLHLQCHFGLDTLSWARHGAAATGVDSSAKAVAAARDLARRAGLEARFVEADVLDLPESLDGGFDIVFTSYGAICWLPDLRRWAEVIARFVAPGGFFYMAEVHPFSSTLAEDLGDGLRVVHPHGADAPLRWEEEGTYADRAATVENRVHYVWEHGLGDVVSALAAAGLLVEYLREHPFTVFPQLRGMVRGDDGYWRLPDGSPRFPLLFSLRASRVG